MNLWRLYFQELHKNVAKKEHGPICTRQVGLWLLPWCRHRMVVSGREKACSRLPTQEGWYWYECTSRLPSLLVLDDLFTLSRRLTSSFRSGFFNLALYNCHRAQGAATLAGQYFQLSFSCDRLIELTQVPTDDVQGADVDALQLLGHMLAPQRIVLLAQLHSCSSDEVYYESS